MPTFIIKLEDPKDGNSYYIAWSTVVDAPITWGLSKEEFTKWYGEEYGRDGLEGLGRRMERVEQNGSSGHPPYDSAEGMISGNRAGYRERYLDKEDILEWYCRRKHDGYLAYRPDASRWRKAATRT